MDDAASITTTGRVVTDRAGQAWVEVPRRSACQACGKEDACSMSVLAGLGGAGKMRFALNGDWTRRDGEEVQVACSQNGLLKAALLAYGPPVLGVVLGAAAMAGLGYGDGGQALGALAGLVTGLSITRWAAASGQLPTLILKKD